jgi:16S rRNA (cytosine1402-N4)-methyltransferase
VLDALDIKTNGKYIDATLGGGGHTLAILEKGGEVLGIDVDEEAIAEVKEKTSGEEFVKNLKIVRGNFSDIETIAQKNGFDRASGILFDLGVSSHQLDSPERGFSFRKDGPLDMRMSRKLTVTARDLINGLSKKELVTLFEKLGEEYRAREIAERIVKSRKKETIETTSQLARLVGRSDSYSAIDPSTKVFQALRIAVNDELNNLREGLKGAQRILGKNGKLVVISFHSLEDRIVKETFKNFSEARLGEVVTEKPIYPTEGEKEANPRSRSAKMRVFKKL